MRNNPFLPILSPYFEWLTEIFGNLADEVIKNNISPRDLVADYLSSRHRREVLIKDIPGFYKSIFDFWESNYVPIEKEIRQLASFKSRFGGDIGPQSSDAVFQRSGLYFDTLIVPDPLLRIAHFPEQFSKINEFYFLKYSIEQILAKDIYLSDVYPPIAVLTADPELAEDRNFDDLSNLAKIDSILLVNDLYEKEFEVYDDILDFFGTFSSAQEAVKEISNPDLFYLIEEAPRDPSSQLEANLTRNRHDWEVDRFLKENKAGYLPFTIMGRMMQINDVLHRSYNQNAHPLISAPVSFHWLSWKIESNQKLFYEQLGIQDNLDFNITNALLSQELRWLGNISQQNLIELRKKGQLEDIRELLRNEIDTLSQLDIDSLEKALNQVDQNLSVGIEKHQSQLDVLDRQYKTDLAISGSSLLISISAAFQPALFPLTPGMVKALGGVIGTTNIKDIVKSTVKYIRERKKLLNAPVGLLWKAQKKNKS